MCRPQVRVLWCDHVVTLMIVRACQVVAMTTQPKPSPFLHLTQARHPALAGVASTAAAAAVSASAAGASGYIPNDTYLGNDPNISDGEEGHGSSKNGPACMLLTGPNMGGKSTLLRQTCIAVILAQMAS
jgi:DNA mismatch repair ATPase MutS